MPMLAGASEWKGEAIGDLRLRVNGLIVFRGITPSKHRRLPALHLAGVLSFSSEVLPLVAE
jgi:hypothetical protein